MNERYEIMKAMHRIICCLNNEDAYMEWIYTVPDEATEDDLQDIAQDDELFADACKLFKSLLKQYADDGLYIDKKCW